MRINDDMINMVNQKSTNLSADKAYAEFECDLLTHYGTCIAQYYGYGILTLNGKEKLSCKFEAGQL